MQYAVQFHITEGVNALRSDKRSRLSFLVARLLRLFPVYHIFDFGDIVVFIDSDFFCCKYLFFSHF